MDKFTALKQRLQALIQQDQTELARKELGKLVKHRIPREHLVDFATFARRAFLPSMGLRLLNGVVRPAGHRSTEATAPEKIEYAICLTQFGAEEEALGLLQGLDASQFPEALLAYAFAQIALWDYAAAIPAFTRYLSDPRVSEYQRLVAMTNLAASHLFEGQYEAASQLLSELRTLTQSADRALLKTGVLQLSAQNAIWSRQWGEAERFLEEAQAEIRDPQSSLAFFNRKWSCFLEVLRTCASPASLAALEAIREEGRQRAHGETARECDRIEVYARRDVGLLARIFYGTRAPNYRRRLLAGYGENVELPPSYTWQLCAEQGPAFHLYEGTVEGKASPAIQPGDLIHRVLVAFAFDFYNLLRIASLHALIYPDEFFNPPLFFEPDPPCLGTFPAVGESPPFSSGNPAKKRGLLAQG